MIDTATIIGIVLGFALIAIAIIICPGSSILMFLDLPSVLITIGGAMAACMVNFPFRDLQNVPRVFRLAFSLPHDSAGKLIADFRRFAEIARRDGILALENVTHEIKDPFLVRGIQLAVDGTDPEVIHGMMQAELEYMVSRHDRGIRVFKQFATYAPAFGMIGTLIGLVIMLGNLQDPQKIGPSLAVAIITTFYGAILSYLVATPVAEKLTIRNNEEAIVREMMIRGVMSIQSGDNPRILEQKLRVFLAPRLRDPKGGR